MSSRPSIEDNRWFFTSTSPGMQRVYRQITEAAASDASVLIVGENGTGKGVTAQRIHQLSARQKGPFQIIDTTLFPKELLESELFGIKNKFLAGSDGKEGLVHGGRSGSLFFDEIGDMALDLQPKLLRFAQSREFRRVGATRDETVDARLLFATNADLLALIRAGRFRQDLYYRIRGICIQLPPLRERPEDILPLAQHLAALHAGSLRRPPPGIDEALTKLLLQHSWPGNVRELLSCMQRLVERAGEGMPLSIELLPDDLRQELEPKRQASIADAGDSSPKNPANVPQGPPLPSDPAYLRVPRTRLVHEILTGHILPRRVAVLLQTHRGGGRSLARQLAAQSGMKDIWLVDSSSPDTPPERFFRKLTRSADVRDADGLYDWLRGQLVGSERLLLIQTEPRGPEELLESVAATVRSLMEEDSRLHFVIIGSERLLRLRTHELYSWLRLLPPSSLIDVPDLSRDDVARILRNRGAPESRADFLHQHSGGHPWLLYELISKNIGSPDAAHAEVKFQLQISRRFERHQNDAAARAVLQRLRDGQPIAPLSDPTVRRAPEQYAEARLYFDTLLTPQGHPRCPAVWDLVG